MPVNIRVASFNVENLFSRARVLNLADHKKTDDLLIKISTLNRLIKKSKYSASDKTNILKLAGELSFYIEIRENIGKLFGKKNRKKIVKASGAQDWEGEISFRRAKFSEMTRKSTAAVIKALKADILCVVEAEDRLTLDNFNKDRLTGKNRFDCTMLIDGNDTRGIDVGLFSRFNLGYLRSHIYDKDSKGTVFSRDCFEAEIKLKKDKSLYILCNHLKSKGYGSQAANDAKRKRQTKQIAKILKDYNLKKDNVVIAGDMNDTPGSDPMKPILNLPDLYDVLELQFGNDMSKRWTYKYGSQKNQIDYLLVSKPLKNAMVAAGVERRGIYGIEKITGEKPFSSITSPSNAASDHGGVWAEFRI